MRITFETKAERCERRGGEQKEARKGEEKEDRACLNLQDGVEDDLEAVGETETRHSPRHH
jgi:hypothetical protein